MGSHGSIHFVQFCIQWSSIALLYYDYFLTFGMEVEYIWRQNFRTSTILYFCCRDSLVANTIYLLTIANKITGKYASTFANLLHALGVVGRAAVVAVWTARTFAVSGKNCWILAYFGAIGVTIVILDIIGVPTTFRHVTEDYPSRSVGGVLAILMVVFEVFAAGLTTFQSVRALNANGPWQRQKNDLTYLILEHGILYFCAVTVLTIASLALDVAIPGGFLQRLLNAYTIPFSGMMTARFLLHLRRWEAKRAAYRSSGAEMDGGVANAGDIASEPVPHTQMLDPPGHM
ncbi:hypothetical protein LshimejAT787_1900750 [Lyophyllum shimeji]|uniref:DUF6533 domain-containing protein n=1 Tax=Lyophyllum shimeji TaxID=47721 RepID=A0A9P3UUB6_LYOSH|nr:hypothetical protein LshimejAT787_1900750 [Lyophyllum shimeji]